jgi:hypothetical protein
MSRSLGNRIPQSLLDHMASQAFWDEVIPVVSMDADGMPRPGMVSGRELKVEAEGRLALSLWQSTRMVSNLEERPQMAAIFVFDGAGYYVRARALRAGGSTGGTVTFFLQVEEVLEDRYPGVVVEPMRVARPASE